MNMNVSPEVALLQTLGVASGAIPAWHLPFLHISAVAASIMELKEAGLSDEDIEKARQRGGRHLGAHD